MTSDVVLFSFLQRVSEELFVLQKNLHHPLIAKVHILAEDADTLMDFLIENKINLRKIVVHNNGKSCNYERHLSVHCGKFSEQKLPYLQMGIFT